MPDSTAASASTSPGSDVGADSGPVVWLVKSLQAARHPDRPVPRSSNTSIVNFRVTPEGALGNHGESSNEPLLSYREGEVMSLTRSRIRDNPSRTPDAPTVFVVDADASVRGALDPLIRSAGWRPSLAASAEEFLERPPVLTPSCLLTELRLPGLSGLELQRHIAERTEIPVIF